MGKDWDMHNGGMFSGISEVIFDSWNKNHYNFWCGAYYVKRK
jgi:hypothetical protein